jgi:signal transduction histidine kinase
MGRLASARYASWIPVTFALLVSIAVIGRWALAYDGPTRVAAVFLLAALVPIAVFAGAYVAERPLVHRIAELEASLGDEQDARRVHDEIYGRFINELRGPLTAVYGFSRHLDDTGIANTSETEELIGLISRDATEVVRKVENIAIAAQIDSGIYRPIPRAVELDRHVVRLVEAMRESRPAISVDARPTVVWCDPAAIEQIFLNIVHIASEAGATTLRIDIEERNGLGIISATDDRTRREAEQPIARDLLGTASALSLRIVPALVEYQGGTMNTLRTLGWTNTVIRLPVATPAQRSADFRTRSQPQSLS